MGSWGDLAEKGVMCKHPEGPTSPLAVPLGTAMVLGGVQAMCLCCSVAFPSIY